MVKTSRVIQKLLLTATILVLLALGRYLFLSYNESRFIKELIYINEQENAYEYYLTPLLEWANGEKELLLEDAESLNSYAIEIVNGYESPSQRFQSIQYSNYLNLTEEMFELRADLQKEFKNIISDRKHLDQYSEIQVVESCVSKLDLDSEKPSNTESKINNCLLGTLPLASEDKETSSYASSIKNYWSKVAEFYGALSLGDNSKAQIVGAEVSNLEVTLKESQKRYLEFIKSKNDFTEVLRLVGEIEKLEIDRDKTID